MKHRPTAKHYTPTAKALHGMAGGLAVQYVLANLAQAAQAAAPAS